jgi:hypothetical protein
VSDTIEVKLSTEHIVINPGETAQVTAEVRNAGDVVEVFSVEVGGIESGWYNLSVASISLFPGDKETITIGLAPPLASASGAGSYTITVKVSSRRDPTIAGTASFSLDVGKVSSYELDLTPKVVRGRNGDFEVVIRNTGNLTNTYKLEGSDPEEMCEFAFKSDTVAVEAGQTGTVPLTVIPRKKPLTGPSKMYRFTISVTPIASEVKTIEGQLECPSLLPKWVIMAAGVGAVGVVAVIVLVVLCAGGPGGFGDVNEKFELTANGFRMYEVKCGDLGNITATANWDGEADRLSLVLFGPDREEGVLARHEDSSPLSVSHLVDTDDLGKGDSWRVYVANLDDENEAEGELQITWIPPED